jgi:hypothetical protein
MRKMPPGDGLKMMQDLIVFAPGTECEFLGSEFPGQSKERIRGTITAISIGHEACVSYEVFWWDGRQRLSCWLSGSQIIVVEEKQLRIGFAASRSASPNGT